MTRIDDLPIEVLRQIFLCLDPKSFLQVCHTSRYWRQLSLWRYTLFWHIDWYLCDSEDSVKFYKFYDYIRRNYKALEHSGSSTLVGSSGSDNISTASSSTNLTDHFESAATSKFANPLSETTLTPTDLLSERTYSRYIKSFDSSLQHKPLLSDNALIAFYHRLLKLQLLGLNVIPTHVLELPATFFDETRNTTPADGFQNQKIECVCFSPDGCYLLVVKRGIDNFHFLYAYQLINVDRNEKSASHKDFIPFLKYFYCWKNDREVDQVVFSTDNHFMGISYNVGFVEVHDLCLAGENAHLLTLNDKFLLPASANSNPDNKQGNDKALIYPRETVMLFSRQYPSSINYLAISANGEVLFLRSQRLGGLIIVNIKQASEIDIPHYRLDLTMSLQYYDKVLILFGWNESIIFGKATSETQRWKRGGITNSNSNSDDATSNGAQGPAKGSLWDYFVYHVQNNISSYFPVEKLVALPKINTYLGVESNRDGGGGVTVKVLLDEDELYGFKPLEDVLEKGLDYEEEEDEGEDEDEDDGASESESGRIREDGDFGDTSEHFIVSDSISNPITQPEDGSQIGDGHEYNIDATDAAESQHPDDGSAEPLGDTAELLDNEDDLGEEEDDEDEDIDTRPEFTIFSRSLISLSDLNYCISQDSTRLAILTPKKIYIYVLREDCVDDGFATGYLPHRTIDVNIRTLLKDRSSCSTPNLDAQDDERAVSVQKFMFIQNDYLLLYTEGHIITYEISADPQKSLQASRVSNKLIIDPNMAISYSKDSKTLETAACA